MERKELFSAARDEQSDLVVNFPDTGMVVQPDRRFWEAVIEMIESLKNEKVDPLTTKDLLPLDKKLRMIKESLQK